MAINRTKEQDEAIRTIDKNIAVNAGAGTGKTKVLTERYLHILEYGELEKGREIESIVAITFTKKATQEMKERIRESIKEKFDIDDKWRKFYIDLEKANISTIHSFCGNLLKENPIEAMIDPLFEVLDEVEGQNILFKIIIDILENNNKYNSDLYKILFLLEQDDFDYFGLNLQNLYKKIRSNGQTVEDIKKMTLEKIENIDIPKDIDSRIEDDFHFLMDETKSNSKYNKLKSELIWELFLKRDFSEYNRIDILTEFQDYIGANKKNEDIVNRLIENISIALFEKEKEFLWAYREILDILIEIDREYKRYKDINRVLDFNDLEYMTYLLLKNNIKIREKYQEKYKYLMIDEFQDTNKLQKEIFYLLASKDKKLDRRNLFIVGDPKQSIYGFRGADVNIFSDVIEDIKDIEGNSPINMVKNFRSVDIIVDFVNNIFNPIIENYISLDHHHKIEDIKNIEIIENESLEIPTGESESKYNKIYEANIIANRIKELVAEGKYKYGDFSILFRAGTNDIIYEEALRANNIPFYNSGGENLYHRQEIIDIINLLKSISSSYDIVSTIGFLRSPMVGLNDESIYFILKHMKDIEEFNILNSMRKINLKDNIENRILEKGIKLLKKYKYEKDIYNLDIFLEKIIKELNYIDILLLYEDGEQRVNNIYKFLEIVKDYLNQDNSTLENFIDYINNIDNLGIFESQRSIKSENADLVKIMTIHKSKGLQFPVVILPEMSRVKVSEVDNLIYNRNIGIGFKYEKKASLYGEIKDKNNKENEEELKRILYVAMTRAEELLIIGNQGSDRGFKKLLEDIGNYNNIKYLNEDIILKENKNIFKKLEKIDIENIKSDIEIPNLIEFDNYNGRYFNSINISQFIEFKKCKRKFFIEYYKPLPDNINKILNHSDNKYVIEPKVRGNIVHKFIEKYDKENEIESLLKEITKYYGYEYNDIIKNELLIFVKNYLQFSKIEYDKIYSEERFYIKIEDRYINGIIDRIYIKNNQAYIYDFKTNLVGDQKELAEFYSPQLRMYADAFEKIYNIPVVYAGIVFLENNNIFEIDINDKLIEKNNDEIKEFIKFITINNKIEDYTIGENCINCPYKNICIV